MEQIHGILLLNRLHSSTLTEENATKFGQAKKNKI